jgi:formate dehydrogenase major subunit
MAEIKTDGGEAVTRVVTTCPYCSAQCGQVAVVGTSGKVYDIYGDVESPTNNGGLCAKGASSLQLVNNNRRVAAFTAAEMGTHPDGAVFNADGTSAGYAYKRVANGGWSKMDLQDAMTEIANGDGTHTGLKGIRNAHTTSWPASYVAGSNSASVMFFGSSHMNNEQNYTYRKLIANFGTSNVEHQARI